MSYNLLNTYKSRKILDLSNPKEVNDYKNAHLNKTISSVSRSNNWDKEQKDFIKDILKKEHSLGIIINYHQKKHYPGRFKRLEKIDYKVLTDITLKAAKIDMSGKGSNTALNALLGSDNVGANEGNEIPSFNQEEQPPNNDNVSLSNGEDNEEEDPIDGAQGGADGSKTNAKNPDDDGHGEKNSSGPGALPSTCQQKQEIPTDSSGGVVEKQQAIAEKFLSHIYDEFGVLKDDVASFTDKIKRKAQLGSISKNPHSRESEKGYNFPPLNEEKIKRREERKDQVDEEPDDSFTMETVEVTASIEKVPDGLQSDDESAGKGNSTILGSEKHSSIGYSSSGYIKHDGVGTSYADAGQYEILKERLDMIEKEYVRKEHIDNYVETIIGERIKESLEKHMSRVNKMVQSQINGFKKEINNLISKKKSNLILDELADAINQYICDQSNYSPEENYMVSPEEIALRLLPGSGSEFEIQEMRTVIKTLGEKTDEGIVKLTKKIRDNANSLMECISVHDDRIDEIGAHVSNLDKIVSKTLNRTAPLREAIGEENFTKSVSPAVLNKEKNKNLSKNKTKVEEKRDIRDEDKIERIDEPRKNVSYEKAGLRLTEREQSYLAALNSLNVKYQVVDNMTIQDKIDFISMNYCTQRKIMLRMCNKFGYTESDLADEFRDLKGDVMAVIEEKNRR